MEAKQPSSQTPSPKENPTANKSGRNGEATVAQSSGQDNKTAESIDSMVLVNELLKVLRRLSEEPKPAKRQNFTYNPLILLVAGSLLGGFVTYLYNNRLQELSVQRTSSDELNRLRIQKIGEVWEQIDKNEPLIDELLERVAEGASGSNKEDFDKISKLVDEDIAIIRKNRFWLGKATYDQLKDYLDITGRYVSDKLLGPPGIDLSETIRKRDKAKHDVLEVKNMFLKGSF